MPRGSATYADLKFTASLARAHGRASSRYEAESRFTIPLTAQDASAYAQAWALTETEGGVRAMLRAAVAMLTRDRLARLERLGIDPEAHAAKRRAELLARFPIETESQPKRNTVGRVAASESRSKPKRR